MTSDTSRDFERRRWPRVPTVHVLQIQHAAGPQQALTRDFSLGGVAVEMRDPPAVGSEVNVCLETDEDERLDLLSVVVRINEVVALEFVDLEPHEALHLRGFLRRRAI